MEFGNHFIFKLYLLATFFTTRWSLFDKINENSIKAESGSDTFAQGSICDIDCPHNAISTVRNVTCECSPRKSQDGEVCRWSPHRRYQTIKCYGGDRSEYLRANPQFDILLGAKSKKDRTDGQKRHRARPRGLSGKSQLRMTSQDVVFTKNHAKQLRELGIYNNEHISQYLSQTHIQPIKETHLKINDR